MSTETSGSLVIMPEQRDLSLPVAQAMSEGAPDADSRHQAYVYHIGDGFSVAVERPYANGTIPIQLGDESRRWLDPTPGFVNGADFRVKRFWWPEEDGILVPTGVLKSVADAIEATEPQPDASNLVDYIRLRRESLRVPVPEGVDIDGIRRLHGELSWAAFQGVDLI